MILEAMGLGFNAGTAWLAGFAVVLAYEAYAIIRHQETLSEYVWSLDRRFPWFRYVVLGGVGVLMYHFFGPR